LQSSVSLVAFGRRTSVVAHLPFGRGRAVVRLSFGWRSEGLFSDCRRGRRVHPACWSLIAPVRFGAGAWDVCARPHLE